MADRSPLNARDEHERAAESQSRPAVILAALLYLVTAYQRTPCPCLARCIVRHLECLAAHERADPVVRQICGAIRETWMKFAGGNETPLVH